MNLEIKRVGQIDHANITFGDLTVLVGPQATGKSILLEFLKLLVDTGQVQEEFRKHGLDWERRVDNFFDIYFGEGMRRIWREGESEIVLDGKPVAMSSLASKSKKDREEHLFFIPAQRVLTLRDGWPRPFTDYAPGDPFTVREFSERLRLLMEIDFPKKQQPMVFPQTGRLKSEIRKLLEEALFTGFKLNVDRSRAQKRLVLSEGEPEKQLPYMVWSAGQREFVPLLLGLYRALPAGATSRKPELNWIVIEEIEMGLHPRAISVVLLLVLDLLARGYRVCLSTHSPHVLEMVWALRIFAEHQADSSVLLGLFNAQRTRPMIELAEEVLKKIARVYYFDSESGRTRDISALDPTSEDKDMSLWGGLGEFSSRASELVAEVISNSRIARGIR